MVVYAEIEIPATGFRIGRAFSSLPGVRVELDRIVPAGDSVVPFIWVRGASSSDVVRATLEQGAVEQIDVLYEDGDRTLYRVVWHRTLRDTVVAIAESNLTLLSGTGTADEWNFEFRGRGKGPLSAFLTSLREDDIPVTLKRLTHERAQRGRDDHDHRLTAAQFEALQLAYEKGYFDDPRSVTADELAAELGISRQAFSGRLRRAIETLADDAVGHS